MKKIIKLRDKYALWLTEEGKGDREKYITPEEAFSYIRANSVRKEGERFCVRIVDNETDKSEIVYSEEEYLEKCPECWLFYDIRENDFSLEDNLLKALKFQSDLLVHEWSTGADYCHRYFIGDIQRYSHMPNHQILYSTKKIMKELNDSAESQIEHYEEVERIGQIVEVVESMGLQVPRNYKYDEALVFEYAKEKTIALRKLHDIKISLLNAYSQACAFERTIIDRFTFGRREVSEAYNTYLAQYSKLIEAQTALSHAMSISEEFVPVKSPNDIDRETDEKMRRYLEEDEL